MKNIKISLISTLVLLISSSSMFAQKTSPYQTDLLKDGLWIGGALGLNALGLKLIADKDSLSDEDLDNLSNEDVWEIDRWAAGNFDEEANSISDIPFFISFATPFLFVLDKETRQFSGQIAVMYVESLATTSALFTITAGLVNKPRPLVYNEDVDMGKRTINNSQRSFFSGHVAASASATFFVAQVFSDFFQDSKFKPYVWAAAATIPAVVGYYRIKSGNHFLTDTIIGYTIGALSGTLIPKIHRKKWKNFSMNTGMLENQPTIGFTYKFK